MDITSFIQSLYMPFLVDLHSTTPENLQEEIAQSFLIYFGQFRNGDLYTGRHQVFITAQDLAEEIPFTEKEIRDYLSCIKDKRLNSSISYKGINIHPNKRWAIGGILDIFNSLLSGKITFYSFQTDLEFSTNIGVYGKIIVSIYSIKDEGLCIKAYPEWTKEIAKKYSGYYASEDGTMEAQIVISKFNMNWNIGNTMKYLIRAGKKDPSKHIEDLEKAKKYIDFEIARIKGE